MWLSMLRSKGRYTAAQRTLGQFVARDHLAGCPDQQQEQIELTD
jgi:hypothetical protein